MEYKNYNIVSDGTFGYKEIKPIGKGSVHSELRGVWVTARDAMRAIDMLTSRKVDENGEGNISV